jgi:hypothetical protein
MNDFELIHNWFELTYAQYLTIPRSILQSMPVEWQRRMDYERGRRRVATRNENAEDLKTQQGG